MKFIKSLRCKKGILVIIMLFMSPLFLLACKTSNPPTNKIEYTVNFYNGKNELIKTMTVKQGEDAVEPTSAEKYMPGMKFVSWDCVFTNIQTNMDVRGIYSNDLITDTDNDGLPDHYEIKYLNLNYQNNDSDGDMILDGDEDFDNDGLTNYDEIKVYHTKPHDADTDDDGLKDGTEITNNLEPFNPDTDGDGLTDGDEIDIYWTLPADPDTDGDGVVDGDEILNGTDPSDETSF